MDHAKNYLLIEGRLYQVRELTPGTGGWCWFKVEREYIRQGTSKRLKVGIYIQAFWWVCLTLDLSFCPPLLGGLCWLAVKRGFLCVGLDSHNCLVAVRV